MKVLAVGAHPDDIELGCAGTLLQHAARGDEVNLMVMTTGEQGPHAARSRISEQEDAAAFIGADLYWGGFEDGAIPEGREGIMAVEAVLHRTGAGIDESARLFLMMYLATLLMVPSTVAGVRVIAPIRLRAA